MPKVRRRRLDIVDSYLDLDSRTNSPASPATVRMAHWREFHWRPLLFVEACGPRHIRISSYICFAEAGARRTIQLSPGRQVD